MKTFTFYGQRQYTCWEECSFSVDASSEEEARRIFLNAIEEDETEEYFNDDWEEISWCSEIDNRIDYYSENHNLIHEEYKLIGGVDEQVLQQAKSFNVIKEYNEPNRPI